MKASGIGFKTGKGHHKPPYGNVPYADPKNHKYPIDAAHIRAAISFFNHLGNQQKGGYSDAEWAAMGRRVAAAANRLIGPGHAFSGGRIVSPASQAKSALARLPGKRGA